MKSFLNKYVLNIAYNDVFKFLRKVGVLKYVEISGKRTNYPTDKYREWFTIEEYQGKDNCFYIKLFLTDKGKLEIEKLLINNNIVSLNDENNK